MAYRWFIGYGIEEKIPHFSTFGKNYMRRFEGTDIFEKIFIRVLEEAMRHNLVDAKTIFVDGTHVKANANIHKSAKVMVEIEARKYDEQLKKEINEDREKHGKKPFDDDDETPGTKEITESTTDPESGLFHKGEHKKCFAYNVQVACDKHGWVLGGTVHKGNKHDSTVFDELYEKVKETTGRPDSLAADAGYKTPAIAKKLIDENVEPYMPYKSPMTKKGYLHKNEYVYDEYYDCYICPNGKILEYSTTNKEGYREYKSKREECEKCQYLEHCTKSKNKTKVIIRHIWAEYLDRVEDNRHTQEGKDIYGKRKETIERVFADAKEKHGMRFTRHNGLAKVKTQVLLTLMVMNLKKLAKMIGRIPDKTRDFLTKMFVFTSNIGFVTQF